MGDGRLRNRGAPAWVATLMVMTQVATSGLVRAEVPSWSQFEPTAGYQARQAEYLEYCAANNGPEKGGVYGQLCLLATDASAINEDTIRTALEEINAREDTADFEFNALLRMMALYGDHPALDGTRQDIIDGILNFKYWLDQPGPDTMCWWSENHQILFATAELLAGQLFPDTAFSNAGMTGAEHIAHATPRILEWLERRGRLGFSEWHSNVYFNEDMPALLNLVDLAENQEIAAKAAMVLDIIAFDFANTYFDGRFATVHGRTYPSKLIGGLSDSTSDAAWIMLELGEYQSAGNFTAAFLVTSDRYWPPPILETIAQETLEHHEHKQRDGIDIDEGPDYGIGYEDYEDVMFWWGMTGYAASKVIDGTFYAVDYYDLWDDFFWSDVQFLEPLVGSPVLEPLSEHYDDLTRGAALEAMSTYAYRTPHYQLSGAQDYNPGMWGAQQHIWQATLSSEAYVFTTAPGGSDDDYMAGDWTGGWLPRATFHQNVGVIQYQRALYPLLENYFDHYTHAYFPQASFDQVEAADGWIFGRSADGYVALYSHAPTQWASDDPTEVELVAEGSSNVWILELGSVEEWGSFEAFVIAIRSAGISISRDQVRYVSPSVGLVEVGWTGPMWVGGMPVDIGPYERWDNVYAYQPFGTSVTTIAADGMRLELDFEAGTRTYSEEQ